jgi:predicted Holliday junction resolvase-like endonuclease
MNKKFKKPKFKSIFRYLYILIIIANLAIIFLLYSFINKRIINVIFTDQAALSDQFKSISEDKNINKFQNTLEIIENRKQKNEIDKSIRNIFQ